MKESTFDSLCNIATERTRKWNKDCIMAVCGDPGIGKSGLAMQLGYATDKDFTPSKNILFYPQLEKAKALFEELKSHHTVIFDESMMTMYCRTAMSKQNITLNQFFSVDVRKNYNNVIILVVEDLRFLDKYFRASRVQYWIEVMHRDKDAYAICFMRDSSPACPDPWRLGELDKTWQWEMRHKKTYAEGRRDWAHVARKSRLFFGDFLYDDLPKRVWDEYTEARLKAKEEYERMQPGRVVTAEGGGVTDNEKLRRAAWLQVYYENKRKQGQ